MLKEKNFDHIARRKSHSALVEFSDQQGCRDLCWLKFGMDEAGTLWVKGIFSGWSFQKEWAKYENVGFGLTFQEMQEIVNYFSGKD